MIFTRINCLIVVAILPLFLPQAVWSQDNQQEPSSATNATNAQEPVGKVNIKTQTAGGMQFWTDVLHFRDWRIQQHALTDHCRLLSPQGTRYAWGNFAHCKAELEKLKREQSLPPLEGKAVVLLHGLGRSRESLEPLAQYLRDNSDYRVINVSYASTRGSLASHAAALRRILENLEGIDEIHFVGHSLGNLVVRHYLQDTFNAKTGQVQDTRIRRMVMLGPPNNGAQLAERFLKLGMVKLVLGKSAAELAADWEEQTKQLAVPPFEFGIIAGNGGGLHNPLIEGESDLFVGVAETKLPGAADFRVVEGVHAFLMQSPEVQEMTLSFLRDGYLTSRQAMQPIQ